MYVFVPPPIPDTEKAKGCWTLNGEALQGMALVRNVCVSDSSAWEARRDGSHQKKAGAGLNKCSRRWLKLVSEQALGSYPRSRVLVMWTRTLPWVTHWLLWHSREWDFDAILFIYKNIQIYLIPMCLVFFFLAGPSWSAPRLYNVPGSPLVEVPPASARVSTCCCQLLTSV